jgi:methionyl-tRNA formyltransferase
LSVLFLGKRDDAQCSEALRFCTARFSNVVSYLGEWHEPRPPELARWEGDFIISYLSRWVVPSDTLRRSRVAAINFHPAPPEYPGIGCTNFALYDEASEYGVTCHHMAPSVDTGPIIAVRRFPILPTDNVASLLARTYKEQLALFYEIAGLIADGVPLPVSAERWTRPPFTRAQFTQLSRITPDMSKDEVRRRVRATTFGSWKPVVDIHGYVFELKTQP